MIHEQYAPIWRWCGCFDNWNKAFAKPAAYSYGFGFRYLLAKKFKLQRGVDVAKGPEEWAYYIVFGSNWMR